jgi:signal transduction histidine kinase
VLRTHSLLQKVALVTIVPVAVLGFVLQRAIEHQVRTRALDQAVRSAGLIATLGVQPQLTTFDLQRGLTEQQVTQLDRALSAPSLDGQLVRIKIWNRDGVIVYSDDHTLIGAGTASGEINEGVVGALHGETESELLRSGGAGGSDEAVDAGTAGLVAAHGALLEVYAPLAFPTDERPSGVFEMYIPFASVDAQVASDARRIQVLLFGGLALLYAVLLPIVAGASRRLRRQAQVEREAAEGLRQADEMKNQFLTAVSHELRTPLAAILGCAVSLGQRHELHLADEDVDDLTGRLEANARKLSRLVSDLLDLDRLAQGVIEPRRDPTDVGELVRTIVEETRVAEQRTVHVDAPPMLIEIDAAKVERIVENLIVNSLRHANGTDLWIRVSPEPDGMLLVVEDNGPGVPLDLRDPIFEPFERGRSSSHAPGVGVGLSIVANFAKLHGGRAWVEERDGGGASFHVHIPGARVPALVPAT